MKLILCKRTPVLETTHGMIAVLTITLGPRFGTSLDGLTKSPLRQVTVWPVSDLEMCVDVPSDPGEVYAIPDLPIHAQLCFHPGLTGVNSTPSLVVG